MVNSCWHHEKITRERKTSFLFIIHELNAWSLEWGLFKKSLECFKLRYLVNLKLKKKWTRLKAHKLFFARIALDLNFLYKYKIYNKFDSWVSNSTSCMDNKAKGKALWSLELFFNGCTAIQWLMTAFQDNLCSHTRFLVQHNGNAKHFLSQWAH